MNARRWIITITFCIISFAALAAYKTMQIRQAIAAGEAFPEPSATVEAVFSQLRLIQPSISTIGEIVAPQTIELRNEIEGRISAVNFVSGATVKQGDILLQLDISEENARLQAAQARNQLAALDLQRLEKLIKQKTISKERLDQAQAQQNIARADINALRAIINKKTLRAPFDAYAGLHQFESGELLPSNTLITTLIGINPYSWVDFNLAYQHSTANVGDSISISTPNSPAQLITGHIIAKDSAISTKSRTLRFRARVEQQLTANAVVNVVLDVGNAEALPVVPITAIQHDGLGSYVFVLDADESQGQYRARRQSVSLGSQKNQQVTIKSGLKVQQLVAANGAFKIRNQMLVYVKQRPMITAQTKPAGQ